MRRESPEKFRIGLYMDQPNITLHTSNFTYDSLEHNFCSALLPQLTMNLNVYLLDEAHLASLDQSQRPKFIFKWIQKLNKKLDATLKNLSNTNVDQESEWLRIETVNIICGNLFLLFFHYSLAITNEQNFPYPLTH